MRLRAHPAAGLSGRASVPGDKSVSHRALLLAALAVGESRITGLLEGADVLATAEPRCARSASSWSARGEGAGGCTVAASAGSPSPTGRSISAIPGTGARLLLGVLAGHPFTTFLTGDASLRAARWPGSSSRSAGWAPRPRPQRRAAAARDHRHHRAAADPLRAAGGFGPGQVRRPARRPARRRPRPRWSSRSRRATIPSACSAQLGAELEIASLDDGRRAVSVRRPAGARGRRAQRSRATSPRPPFRWSRPLLAPGSALRLDGVGVNPLRTGLLDCLLEMGGRAAPARRGASDGEPVAALELAGGPLAGIEVPAERAPRMIDEYPILAVAAACARGTDPARRAWPSCGSRRATGSPRSRAGSSACGVEVEVGADSLVVHGRGGPPPGGGVIDAHHDHRIAMSFLVLGALARSPGHGDRRGDHRDQLPGLRGAHEPARRADRDPGAVSAKAAPGSSRSMAPRRPARPRWPGVSPAHFGLAFLDTGLLYRAVARRLPRQGDRSRTCRPRSAAAAAIGAARPALARAARRAGQPGRIEGRRDPGGPPRAAGVPAPVRRGRPRRGSGRARHRHRRPARCPLQDLRHRLGGGARAAPLQGVAGATACRLYMSVFCRS